MTEENEYIKQELMKFGDKVLALEPYLIRLLEINQSCEQYHRKSYTLHSDGPTYHWSYTGTSGTFSTEDTIEVKVILQDVKKLVYDLCCPKLQHHNIDTIDISFYGDDNANGLRMELKFMFYPEIKDPDDTRINNYLSFRPVYTFSLYDYRIAFTTSNRKAAPLLGRVIPITDAEFPRKFPIISATFVLLDRFITFPINDTVVRKFKNYSTVQYNKLADNGIDLKNLSESDLDFISLIEQETA